MQKQRRHTVAGVIKSYVLGVWEASKAAGRSAAGKAVRASQLRGY